MNTFVIASTLKKILKKQKLTYAKIATELGMSESGIKKLFSAKDLSLVRLNQIAKVLNVPLSEIIRSAEESKITEMQLSTRQEMALVENASLFRIFWLLTVEARSLDKIKKNEKISKEQLQKYIMKLENLDLIRVGKNGRISSDHSGAVRWQSNGPLIKKLNKEWSHLTIDKVLRSNEHENLHRLLHLQLTLKSKLRLFEKINDIVLEYAALSRREKMENHSDTLCTVSAVIAVASTGFLDN